MSVSLNPSASLGFRRPLTTLVKRSLTITNNNSQPVAFKVKTTAPKLYCVRPNSGRVEPWETVEVSVMLQALKEDPPLNTKCKDKFLIQSTIITPEKEALPVHAIWSSPDAADEGKVHQQKLRVTYLPAEGQTLEEEDENLVDHILNLQNNIPHPPAANGHPPSHMFELTPAPSQQPEERASTPTQDAVERQMSSHTVVEDPPYVPETSDPQQSPTLHPENTEASFVDTTTDSMPETSESVPESEPLAVPAPRHVAPPPPITGVTAPITAPSEPVPVIITKENPVNEELYAKYNHAQLEIERLKEQIASLSELRRRPRAPSDADSTVASDIQTVIEETPFQQEGVPVQIVVIIAFGVFFTTYLFF